MQILTEVGSRELIQANWRPAKKKKISRWTDLVADVREYAQTETKGRRMDQSCSVSATGLDHVLKTRQTLLFKVVYYQVFLLLLLGLQPSNGQTVFSTWNKQNQADFQQPVKQAV